MSLYIIVGIYLLFGSLREIVLKKSSVLGYRIRIIILLLLGVFRFGQGSDYYGYWWLYNLAKNTDSINQLLKSDMHGENGWRILTFLFGNAEVSFSLFVALVTIIEIFFLDRFITRYCRYKMTALLLAYPTLYLTYIFSALRQGLILCIFLGLLLDYYLDKQYKKYYIITILCSFIHSLALLLLFIPLLDRMLKSVSDIWKFIAVSWGTGILLSTGIFNGILSIFLPDSILRYFNGNVLSIAVIERLITYIIVSLLCVRLHDKKFENDGNINKFYKIYSFGMIVYGIFMYMPSVASRINYIFKCLEIAIFSNKLAIKNRYRKVCIAYIVVLTGFMLLKNINSYIEQGSYFDSINIFNYPYVSIFNKDKIYEYRYIKYQINSDWY